MSMQRGKVVLRVLSLLRRSPSLQTYHYCRRSAPNSLSVPLLVRPFSASPTVMAYKIIEKGCLNTMDYRIFFADAEGKPLSPFHDIPLYANEEDKTFNMVVEIPRWTNAKMEISKDDPLNPIKQDVKKGAVRFVKNCFPHHGYIWNYGALPQIEIKFKVSEEAYESMFHHECLGSRQTRRTWEDPTHAEEATGGTKGDCDPIDVCEIGYKVHKRGAVIQVKALGILCLIDEGETDWKVLCIDVTDPLAKELNDVDDIEKKLPGFISATVEWFKVYKIPDGKPANNFAFNGECKNRDSAIKTIEETHEQWKRLVVSKEAECDAICCKNTCVEGSTYKIDPTEANEIIGKAAPQVVQPASISDEVDKWHYIDTSSL